VPQLYLMRFESLSGNLNLDHIDRCPIDRDKRWMPFARWSRKKQRSATSCQQRQCQH
jgi:hypothetical protein